MTLSLQLTMTLGDAAPGGTMPGVTIGVAVLSAVVAILSLFWTYRNSLRLKRNEAFLSATSYLEGKTQRRIVGVSIVEGFWEHFPASRPIYVPLLAGQSIRLLMGGGENTVAEQYNLRRMMSLLVNYRPPAGLLRYLLRHVIEPLKGEVTVRCQPSQGRFQRDGTVEPAMSQTDSTAPACDVGGFAAEGKRERAEIGCSEPERFTDVIRRWFIRFAGDVEFLDVYRLLLSAVRQKRDTPDESVTLSVEELTLWESRLCERVKVLERCQAARRGSPAPPADPLLAAPPTASSQTYSQSEVGSIRWVTKEELHRIAAYYLWLNRGRPLGDPLTDWFSVTPAHRPKQKPKLKRKPNR